MMQVLEIDQNTAIAQLCITLYIGALKSFLLLFQCALQMVHTYIVGFLRTTKLPINKVLCSTGQLGMHLRIEVMQLLSIAVKCLLHNALYIMHYDVLQQTLLLPI